MTVRDYVDFLNKGFQLTKIKRNYGGKVEFNHFCYKYHFVIVGEKDGVDFVDTISCEDEKILSATVLKVDEIDVTPHWYPVVITMTIMYDKSI